MSCSSGDGPDHTEEGSEEVDVTEWSEVEASSPLVGTVRARAPGQLRPLINSAAPPLLVILGFLSGVAVLVAGQPLWRAGVVLAVALVIAAAWRRYCRSN